MFANFLYFVIALLILTLYKPPEEIPLSAWQALVLFLGLSALFAFVTRRQFERLKNQTQHGHIPLLDQRFTQLVTRHSIIALCLFALDIWALHLPSYLQDNTWFNTFPTLGSFFFLVLFVFYLSMVWYLSYPAHKEIYRTDLSRRTYVYSNAAFSIPILIPWALLFGISDIIGMLPWELPKGLLDTVFGQIGYFLTFLLIAACLAPVLIRRFWRCRPLEDGEHRRRITELCHRSGVTYADIVYWPIFGGRMITAGVMGLVGRFRYILVTKALLYMLTPDEIDQVIAHEIGHVKRKHLLLYLLFFIGFMLISYAVVPLSYYLIFFINPVFTSLLSLSLDPKEWVDYLGGAMLVMAVIIYFRYIFGYFMRNFERQADLYVFSLFPSVQPLIATFGKIVHSSGQPADKPNWHHFSIQQRVDYLYRCQSSPQWIERHDKKVRNSIIAFLVALIIGCGVVYHLNHYVFDQEKRQINVVVLENYIETKSPKTPQDAPYFFLLGDIYIVAGKFDKAALLYEQGMQLDPDFDRKALILTKLGSAYFEGGHHQKAIRAWSEALELSPREAELLNNLAWAMATTTDKSLFNPAKALELAQKALSLKTSPHILDTYAEALFINGRVEEAIVAEEKALDLNPEDRDIYQKQLEKFRKALK
jgi:Zn-dependent protease with chaperone function